MQINFGKVIGWAVIVTGLCIVAVQTSGWIAAGIVMAVCGAIILLAS